MEVKNKIVIVTGASSGIGLAAAKLLTERGAKLALVSRSKEKLEELSKELPESIAIPADMTKPDDIKRMVEQTIDHFGRIDILVNNAGQGYYATLEKTNLDIFHHIFDLNLTGSLIAMQQVVPIMRRQGEGAIINISSGTALMHLPNLGVYSSSKRALAGISLTAREELKKDNIIVGVVYPYITLTNFGKNTIRDPHGEDWLPGESPTPADTADYVAQKILEGIENGDAEIFAHDWMKKIAEGGA
jgi:short-subunit dehydrogenase